MEGTPVPDHCCAFTGRLSILLAQRAEAASWLVRGVPAVLKGEASTRPYWGLFFTAIFPSIVQLCSLSPGRS